ncbi:hypothetical protein GE118_03320 [Mycoplasma sp. NEAQ87857]|uniref:hypothetical protein n=1 Tax=Mycoplasma sp. NEAQ87857 TaxID=2683967 RepID=UPI001316E07B|nr:hypothetical protein [Mycoplasma sp. NEAQ87857]QGZ97819.1 hypothetical protein GE118_03320 [Mycoplasma sp. NEAQ87857]
MNFLKKYNHDFKIGLNLLIIVVIILSLTFSIMGLAFFASNITNNNTLNILKAITTTTIVINGILICAQIFSILFLKDESLFMRIMERLTFVFSLLILLFSVVVALLFIDPNQVNLNILGESYKFNVLFIFVILFSIMLVVQQSIIITLLTQRKIKNNQMKKAANAEIEQ